MTNAVAPLHVSHPGFNIGNLGALPSEILARVVAMGDINSVLKLRRVCHGMRHFIDTMPRLSLIHMATKEVDIAQDKAKAICQESHARLSRLAFDKATPAAKLHSIARLKNESLQLLMCTHPNLADKTYKLLAKSSHERVRLAIAKNPRTPFPMLVMMHLHDGSPAVKRAALSTAVKPSVYYRGQLTNFHFMIQHHVRMPRR